MRSFNPTSKRPDDLATAPTIAAALNSDVDTLHITHSPLRTWITSFDEFARRPAVQDHHTAEDIHLMAANGEIAAFREGGIPERPRRVLYSVSEVRAVLSHLSHFREDGDDQDEDQDPHGVPGDLANLPQAVQRVTRNVTVPDVKRLIAQGKVKNWATPIEAVQDGVPIVVDVPPAVSVAELERVTGGHRA
ncbi:hypothetical protein [Corynebacterium glyciniphilum]|uniref:hypothetical protein n=1 Tax=Corynebacterium glyciniphilum TaxID=1404244 RepID=UPI0011AB54E3|nr:hypothetical protein [Corynebacterium glyciniphilum]